VLAEQALTTLTHLGAPESQANFRRLQEKWSSWRLSEPEHKWLDLTDCQFIGEGTHEIAVFTFSRHLRLSRLSGRAEFPVWVAAGPHWSDRWHDADGMPYKNIPIIGIFRSISDPAAFVEPLRVLAVISCANAQFVFDEMAKRVPLLSDQAQQGCSPFSNPRFRRVRGPIEPLLEAAGEVTALPSPSLRPIQPRQTGAVVSISLEELRHVSERWEAFVEIRCAVLGNGQHVVYAYTFCALEDAASLSGDDVYPVKVGWTSVYEEAESAPQAAASRISCQVAFPEAVRVLALLACPHGRAAEMRLHRQLRPRHISCIAKEWFATNGEEIRHLMKECAG